MSYTEMEQQRANKDLSPAVKFYNIILLGITFMLVIVGYNTCGMIEQTVLKSYKKENKDFQGDGFMSLAIIYSVVAVATWLAPSILSILGPKYSLILAGTIHTLYVANFIKPITEGLYICSVLQGLGVSVLWTSQGKFLTVNSDETTMGRNSAIFITLSQLSSLFSSLYVYFAWRGVTTVTDHQRIPLMIGLTAVTGSGTICMLFLRSHPNSQIEEILPINTKADENTPLLTRKKVLVECEMIENETSAVVISERSKPSKAAKALIEFKKAINVLKTRDMLQLTILAGYCGIEEAFWPIYATSIGDTSAYGEDADRLVGLTMTSIAAGKIIGGITVGLLNMYTSKHGRAPGILLAMCVHLLAFFVVFLNTPDESTEHETRDFAYVKPNEATALASAILIGFGDAAIYTQLFTIYGLRYSEDSAPAYALCCLTSSLFGAMGLFYGGHLVVKWQLLILVIVLIPGSLCFIDVDQRLQKTQRHKALDTSE